MTITSRSIIAQPVLARVVEQSPGERKTTTSRSGRRESSGDRLRRNSAASAMATGPQARAGLDATRRHGIVADRWRHDVRIPRATLDASPVIPAANSVVQQTEIGSGRSDISPSRPRGGRFGDDVVGRSGRSTQSVQVGDRLACRAHAGIMVEGTLAVAILDLQPGQPSARGIRRVGCIVQGPPVEAQPPRRLARLKCRRRPVRLKNCAPFMPSRSALA